MYLEALSQKCSLEIHICILNFSCKQEEKVIAYDVSKILPSSIVTEKAMATHSSTLAWKIPGTGEPDWLPSMGSHRVGHDCSNLAEAAL